MPSAEILTTNAIGPNMVGGNPVAKTRCLEPLVYSGLLERFTYADLTPVIGREYEGLQVTELLSTGDSMIRDLASISKHFILRNHGRSVLINLQLVSQRGVVFLRDQVVTPEEMNRFCLRLTEVSGCVGAPSLVQNTSLTSLL